MCCDNCEYKHPSNAMLIKNVLIQKRDSGKHQIDCYQPWTFTNSATIATLATNCKFIRVRNYLKIKTDVVIDNDYNYDKREICSRYKKARRQTLFKR